MINRVLLTFAGCIDTAHTHDITSIPTELGGEASFAVPGAASSQCKTNDGRGVVECNNGNLTILHLSFKGRIKGVCNHIILKPVQEKDDGVMFICGDWTYKKTYSYQIEVSEPATSTSRPATSTLNHGVTNMPGPATSTSRPAISTLNHGVSNTAADAKEMAQAILGTVVALTVLVPLILVMVLVLWHYNSERLKSCLQEAVGKTDEIELSNMLNSVVCGENGRSDVDNSQILDTPVTSALQQE